MDKINIFTLNKGFRFRFQSIFLILFLALFLSACGAVHKLNKIQTAFNKTSVMENQHRSSTGEPSDLAIANSEIQDRYTRVINSLNGFENKDVNKLKMKKLWARVLTMKSHSYISLGENDKAKEAAQEALLIPHTDITDLELASVISIPGKIRINQAKRIIDLSVPTDLTNKKHRLIEVEKLLQNGIRLLDQTRQKFPTHPVRFYLIDGQLGGYKNLRDAYSKLVSSVAVPKTQDKKDAKCNLWRLTEGLVKENDLEEAKAKVALWENKLGIKASVSGAECSSP